MTSHGRASQALAVCLSALAGYTDAVGFLATGGFFVSFMSGNSTRLAVGIARRSPQAAMAGALIGAFVLGVVVGSLLGRSNPRWRRPLVLSAVALLLAAAAVLGSAGAIAAAAPVIALAMGAENTAFERDGDIHFGVTYMTGALVKLGQRLATALAGGDRFGWVAYLLLWSGLLAGAVAGALAFSAMAFAALWIGAGCAAGLAIVCVVALAHQGAGDGL